MGMVSDKDIVFVVHNVNDMCRETKVRKTFERRCSEIL